MIKRRRINEWHENHEFPEDVHFFVNGKEIKPIGYDVEGMFYNACKRNPKLEMWIRSYMNSFGDPYDPDGDWTLDELCYWFVKQLRFDFNECEDGEFYVDDSYNGIRVEIFDNEPIRESRSRALNRRRYRR